MASGKPENFHNPDESESYHELPYNSEPGSIVKAQPDHDGDHRYQNPD